MADCKGSCCCQCRVPCASVEYNSDDFSSQAEKSWSVQAVHDSNYPHGSKNYFENGCENFTNCAFRAIGRFANIGDFNLPSIILKTLFISLVLIPWKVTSAPLLATPHWQSPCHSLALDIMQSRMLAHMDAMPEKSSDEAALKAVVLSSKIALQQAETFRSSYVKKIFMQDLWEYHSMFKKQKYIWLHQDSNIQKTLGEKLRQSQLKMMKPNEEYTKIFRFLQRIAVAFEQVVADLNDNDSAFKTEFARAETFLRNILCEMTAIVPELKSSTFEHATRDLMTPEYRHMDSMAHRHVRDWLIFRDYMNIVEYLMQVADYFSKETV